MNELMLAEGVRARVNWSRWIADCATCPNAWQIIYGQTGWICNNCGTINPIIWPPDPAAIEFLLAVRPNPFTRSWSWPETLDDLLIENAAHGLVSALETTDPEVKLMVTIDDRVVGGVILPYVERVRELAGAGQSPLALGTA